MATRTPTLRLQKPGKGEFKDSWHTPVNQNSDAIDTWAGDINQELTAARFNAATLAAFLEVGHEATGDLKPSPEVLRARSSFYYDLAEEIRDLNILRDKELWQASSGQTSLRDGIAFPGSFGINKILSGPTNPVYVSGNTVGIAGGTTPYWMLVSGRVARIRTNKSVVVTGAAGDYYLYAEYNGSGVEVYPNGVLPDPRDADVGESIEFLGEISIHMDDLADYTLLDVKPGDLLTYKAGEALSGDYLIEAVAPTAEDNPPLSYAKRKLRIKGVFDDIGSTSEYKITDPFAVTLGYTLITGSPTPVANRIYLGEFHYDGTSATSAPISYSKGDVYVGDWRSFDVTTSPDQTEIWNHNLGTDLLDVQIQVSAVNTGLGDIEELTTCKVGSSLAFPSTAVSGTCSIAINDADVTLNPSGLTAGGDAVVGSASATNPAAIAGTTAATVGPVVLSGSVYPVNAVLMKYTNKSLTIKNAVANKLYTNFAGVASTTGYVRVIITKKG